MDYKYIEQLLERYWQCTTTAEEEAILRTFFGQAEVPAHLLPYKTLFACQQADKQMRLGKDFDRKVLKLVEEETVDARPLTWNVRLAPFYKAAASVIIIFTVALSAQHWVDSTSGLSGTQPQGCRHDGNPNSTVVCNHMATPLEQVSAELTIAPAADSTQIGSGFDTATAAH